MKFYCELKKLVDDSYDIEIGRGLSDTLISDIKDGLCGKIKKFAVVTDSIVEPLYAKEIYEKLIAAGYSSDMFVIPEGEKSKTRAMKEFVEDSMLEKGYRRDCCVIAVGGGGAPCFFDNMEFMNGAGQTVYLKVSVEELAKRLELCKSTRPILEGRSGDELRAFIAESLEKREPFYSKASIVFDAEEMMTDQDVYKISQELATRL